MKSYKKPVSCNVSGASTGVIPFVVGAMAGHALLGAAAAVGAAVGAKAVTSLSSDDFSIRFKPMDVSPLKLGVV